MDLTIPQIFVIGFITGIIIAYAKHSHNLWLEWFGYGCVGLILAYLAHDALKHFYLLLPASN